MRRMRLLLYFFLVLGCAYLPEFADGIVCYRTDPQEGEIEVRCDDGCFIVFKVDQNDTDTSTTVESKDCLEALNIRARDQVDPGRCTNATDVGEDGKLKTVKICVCRMMRLCNNEDFKEEPSQHELDGGSPGEPLEVDNHGIITKSSMTIVALVLVVFATI